jgi:CHASE3 domain sensor protein
MKNYKNVKDKRTEQEIEEQNKMFGKIFLLLALGILIAFGITLIWFNVFD